MWEHYYKDDPDGSSRGRKKIRRISKKEIIVRTLKKKAPQGETVGLQDLSKITGLSAHNLSGHLTHLVHEGKVVRRGRGLFALDNQSLPGRDSGEEIKKLVSQVVRESTGKQIEEKIVINNRDHSENRRMMLDFLNDMLLTCSEVEVTVKCKKDQKKDGGKICIELRAQ